MSKPKFFAIFASIGVLLIVILGVLALGSPAERIAKEFDRERIQALKINVSRIEQYVRHNQVLPESLEETEDGKYGYYSVSSRDPRTNEVFRYKKKGNSAYEICATFEAEYQPEEHVIRSSKYGPSVFDIFGVAYDGTPEVRMYVDEEWYYEPGEWCFQRDMSDVIVPFVPTTPSRPPSPVRVY